MSDLEKEYFSDETSEGRVLTQRKIGEIRCETGRDFTLPDYMGEVKKLLSFTAKPIPSVRYDEEGGASFCGIVAYSAIYSDGEDRLSEASFTSDYEFTVASPEKFADMEAYLKLTSVSIRLMGPRKLSAKATICAECYALCPLIAEPANTEGLECRKETVSVRSAEYLKTDEREYAEECARLEGILPEEVDVVFSRTRLDFDSCEAKDDGIHLLARVHLFAAVRISDGEIKTVEKDIISEQIIPIESHRGIVGLSPRGYVSSERVSLNMCEENEEYYTSVVFNITLECSVRVDKNLPTDITLDGYKCGCESVCEYKKTSYQTLRDSISDKRSFTLEITPAEISEAQLLSVIFADATARILSKEASGGACKISLEADITLICECEGSPKYASIRVSRPLEYSLRIGEAEDISARVEVASVSASLAGDAPSVELLLLTELLTSSSGEITRLCAVNGVDSELVVDDTVISVYYPECGESLWDVAKRYRVPVSELAAANMLGAECIKSPSGDRALEGVEYLIIPNSFS